MSKRTKQLIWGGVTALVLAGVVFGGWALSAPRRQTPVPPTIQLSSEQQSQQAYDEGMAALQSGNTTVAVTSFRRAIELDPSNTVARSKLTEITQPKPPVTKPTSPTVDPFLTKVGDIQTLLPRALDGFTVGTATGTGSDADVPATPSSPGSPVAHVQWSVHDRGSKSKGDAFVTSVSKKLYSKDVAPVTINGTKAYFATDGTRFATVVYVRGRYVFEVVVTTAAGPPASARPVAEKAAAAFPSKP